MAGIMREDVAAARKDMSIRYGARREIRRLNDYLRNDETVDSMVAGKYEEGRGLIILTTRRILFLHDGIFSRTSQDFALHTVSSVEWHSRIFFGDLIIFGEGSEARITGVWRTDGQRVSSLIRQRIGRPLEVRQADANPAFNAQQSEEMLSHLERLNRLRDGGAIDEQEYNRLKRELFNR